MLGRTHALTGVAAGLAVAGATGAVDQVPVAAYGVAAFTALIPDLDQHKAMATRYVVNKPLHMVLRHFRHRRFTHSLLGIAVFSVGVLGLWSLFNALLPDGLSPWFAALAIVGFISHIVADMFNKQGVHLLYPFVIGKVEWISVPLPRALRISTIYDPKGPPITLGRLQAYIPTELLFFKIPVYVLIAFVAWHNLDALVSAIRVDVWSAVNALPSSVQPVAESLLR